MKKQHIVYHNDGNPRAKVNIKFGKNVAVFILFFGIALAEAFQSKNWLLAILFILLGLVFLYADNLKKA